MRISCCSCQKHLSTMNVNVVLVQAGTSNRGRTTDSRFNGENGIIYIVKPLTISATLDLILTPRMISCTLNWILETHMNMVFHFLKSYHYSLFLNACKTVILLSAPPCKPNAKEMFIKKIICLTTPVPSEIECRIERGIFRQALVLSLLSCSVGC